MAHHETDDHAAAADARRAPRPASRDASHGGTRRSTAARSTSPRSTCSAGSRSRSPASSGRWTRRSSDRTTRVAIGDRTMTERIRIYEVGPRDGLQNEATPIPTATKARFIELLADAGLREIEATSFVAPRAIPQLADADALLAASFGRRASATRSSSRTSRGMARAEAAGADAIAVFTATTDAFTTANIGMTVDESLAAFAPVLERAGELGWWRRGYVSTAFGCPYTGRVEPARAVEVALRLLDLGVDEVCFGDTIGVGVPAQVADADRAGRRGRHPARADRLPLPRHARDGARQRRGRARRRRPLLRCLGGRDRRLPVRAGRGRQSRHGGPRLLPRRVRLGVGRRRSRASSPRPGSSPTRSVGRSRPRSARPAAGTRRPAPRPSDERDARPADRARPCPARERAQIVPRGVHAARRVAIRWRSWKLRTRSASPS